MWTLIILLIWFHGVGNGICDIDATEIKFIQHDQVLWWWNMWAHHITMRHSGRDCVPNHQPYDCLLNRLFRRKTLKLRITDLCAGNSPMTGEFPAQMASNAENVSIWWRHHGLNKILCIPLVLCSISQCQKLRKIFTGPIQVTFELYGHLRCLQVLYSK